MVPAVCIWMNEDPALFGTLAASEPAGVEVSFQLTIAPSRQLLIHLVKIAPLTLSHLSITPTFPLVAFFLTFLSLSLFIKDFEIPVTYAKP